MITLNDKNGQPLTGNYPYSGSKNGTVSNGGKIQLKDGEEITVSNLPANTQYLFEEAEANEDGYITSASDVSGVIKAGDFKKAVFVNNKEKPTKPGGGKGETHKKTTLTVEKKWEKSDTTHPDFVIVLS